MAEQSRDGMNRRGPARHAGQPPLTVRPRRRGQQQAPASPAPTRDGQGLTPWHYLRGRQVICGTCNCRPCDDRCTEQWMPDTLHLKASRANLTIDQWAAEHPDWIGWTLHAEREDVATFVASLANAEERTPKADERRIPVGAAMEQAMAVMAGRVQAAEVVPVYEARS